MWGRRRGGERARRSRVPGAPLCPEEVGGVLPRGRAWGTGLGCGGPMAQRGVVLWGEEGSVGPGCQAGAPERLFGLSKGAGTGCHGAGLPAWDRVATPGSLFLAPCVVFRLLKLAALSRIGRGKSGFPHGQGALHWGQGETTGWSHPGTSDDGTRAPGSLARQRRLHPNTRCSAGVRLSLCGLLG